ncbi:hypothetical protein MVEN_00102400 [Mycena venus]|uniref:Uncharacterized protein n=1 Tax=Mycena venus TaxID=2733690 RepID=A0A8H6Z4Z3_9AGAR|nr:hypothetical protein MVEN_00102400 [Mycena venus]
MRWRRELGETPTAPLLVCVLTRRSHVCRPRPADVSPTSPMWQPRYSTRSVVASSHETSTQAPHQTPLQLPLQTTSPSTTMIVITTAHTILPRFTSRHFLLEVGALKSRTGLCEFSDYPSSGNEGEEFTAYLGGARDDYRSPASLGSGYRLFHGNPPPPCREFSNQAAAQLYQDLHYWAEGLNQQGMRKKTTVKATGYTDDEVIRMMAGVRLAILEAARRIEDMVLHRYGIDEGSFPACFLKHPLLFNLEAAKLQTLCLAIRPAVTRAPLKTCILSTMGSVFLTTALALEATAPRLTRPLATLTSSEVELRRDHSGFKGQGRQW